MFSEIFCGKKRNWAKIVDLENIYSDDGIILYTVPYLLVRKLPSSIGIYYRYMNSEEIVAEFKNKDEIRNFSKALEDSFDAI